MTRLRAVLPLVDSDDEDNAEDAGSSEEDQERRRDDEDVAGGDYDPADDLIEADARVDAANFGSDAEEDSIEPDLEDLLGRQSSSDEAEPALPASPARGATLPSRKRSRVSSDREEVPEATKRPRMTRKVVVESDDE